LNRNLVNSCWRSARKWETTTTLQRTISPQNELCNRPQPLTKRLLPRWGFCLFALVSFTLHSLAQTQYLEPYTFVTLAGNADQSGYADGIGSNALFNFPYALAVDRAGNVYIADSGNSVIRKAAPVRTAAATNWVVTTLAGHFEIGTNGYPTVGYADGVGTNALFNSPTGIAVDESGALYVSDTGNVAIRKITPTPINHDTNWVVTTIAGQPGQGGCLDGTNNGARFSYPVAIAVNGAGDVFVGDNYPGLIRKIQHQGANWIVNTLVGDALLTNSTWIGFQDGLGTNAQFGFVETLCLDPAGNLIAADSINSAIRKMSPVGTNWLVTTLAGPIFTGGIGAYADGPRWAGWLWSPIGVGADRTGNVFAGDTGNAAIRKITPDGVVTTVAGRRYGQEPDYTPVYGSSDGTGIDAMFRSPAGVAFDPAGNLYVVDYANHNIRVGWRYTPPPDPANYGHPEFNVQPQSQTVAATYQAMFAVAITNATAVGYQWRKEGLNIPGATNAVLVINNVCSQDAGMYQALVYYTPGNHPHPNPQLLESTQAVLTVTVPYTFTGLAGWLEPGYSNGVGSQARFDMPLGMAIDNAGTVYVADSNNSLLRSVTRAGVVSTLSGWEVAGPGVPPGGRPAQFTQPIGLAGDAAGNLYLASWDSTIKKLTWAGTNWLVSTIAGAPWTHGSADGIGSQARFGFLWGLASDTHTNLYVVDLGNETIRKLSPLGTNWYVTTLAGTPGVPGMNDGTNGDAQFTYPRGLAADAAGNVFVADTGNHSIRRITPSGVVTTIAGSRPNIGSVDGLGNVAQFLFPNWVAVDPSGALYVADQYNSAIRKLVQIGTNWLVTTIAGSAGNEGQFDGTGKQVQFVFPRSIAIDGLGNLYIADQFNLIRKGWAADRPPAVVLNAPVLSEDQIRLDFTLASGAADSFTLLQSGLPYGPWAVAPAVLTTNVPGVSFSFTTPQSHTPAKYYRLHVR
jgi:sugar lactone lactonase YvrE